MQSNEIVVVDLFAGAGGLSFGTALACERLGLDVTLHAVNHDAKAIETHERNHPWAHHYNAKVESLQPRAVVGEDVDVKLLSGGPSCTHFSRARGGKPVDEQKRASPWHILDWVAKLLPENVLVENVPELRNWGPVIDGTSTNNGTFFDAWTTALEGLGYHVSHRVLTAADYGDATSRKRLFIIAKRDARPAWPPQSHSEDGEKPGTDPWRPAADIIDWSDLGSSIWTRDIEQPRVQSPPKEGTMKRIADGLRRYADPELARFADAVAALDRERIYAMRDDVVPVAEAANIVEERSEPFLVEGPTPALDDPEGACLGLCPPYLLGQQGGAVARDVNELPCPTVATAGAISLTTAEPLIVPRDGSQRGYDSNPAYVPTERPLHTVTAQNHDGHLATPFLIQYNGQSGAQPVDEPVPTIPTRDRFALIVPELYPYGLDLRFRMLQPPELAAAQGFPETYEFAGNKTEVTEQIGNAVPVHLASRLSEHLLSESDPSLAAFTGETPADGGDD